VVNAADAVAPAIAVLVKVITGLGNQLSSRGISYR
jgi:hypothetical protein